MIRQFLFKDAEYRIVEILDRQTGDSHHYAQVKSKYLPFWIYIPFLWRLTYNTYQMIRAKEHILGFRDFILNTRYTKTVHKIDIED